MSLVNLGGHNEIVVGETARSVGRESYLHIAPADSKIGVVTFGFREIANLICKLESIAEVAELKATADACLLEFPSGIKLRE